MQRSLATENRWYKFYQNVEVNEDGSQLTIPEDFYNDGMMYDTDSFVL